MNRKASLAFASLLVVGFASLSNAQAAKNTTAMNYDPSGGVSTTAQMGGYGKPMGLSVRVGVWYPSNGDARTVEGQGWFAGGLEYKGGDLKYSSSDPRYSAIWTVSLDYYGKGSYSNVPLLINYVGRTDQIYYTVGAGAGFGRVPKDAGGSTSDTEFAFQAGVGYDFTKSQMPLFVELKYFGSSESKLGGFGIYAGARF